MPTSEVVVVIEPLESGGSIVWAEVDGKLVQGRVLTLGQRLSGPPHAFDQPAISLETLSGLQERRVVDTGTLGRAWPYTQDAKALLARADRELEE